MMSEVPVADPDWGMIQDQNVPKPVFDSAILLPKARRALRRVTFSLITLMKHHMALNDKLSDLSPHKHNYIGTLSIVNQKLQIPITDYDMGYDSKLALNVCGLQIDNFLIIAKAKSKQLARQIAIKSLLDDSQLVF